MNHTFTFYCLWALSVVKLCRPLGVCHVVKIKIHLHVHSNLLFLLRVTPQCYGCINHVYSMNIIIYSKHIMIIIYLEPCHSMQKCDLNYLNRLPMLMFEWTILVFVLYALVISLSMLNLTLGIMFMLITSPK